MYAALLAALAEGQTVVTANNRLSRTLRFQYDRAQQQAGALAWASPDVCTWAHWLQRLWQESRLRGGVARDRVLLSDTAADWLWQQSIAAADPDLPAGIAAQLVKQARETWRLVNDWEVLAAPEWTSAGLSPDQRAWLRWSGQFRERCGRQRWIDPEQLPVLLAIDVKAGLFDALGPVYFAGFDSWPPARLTLIDALREQGVVVVSGELTLRRREGQVAGYGSADAYAELLAAARWARSLISVSPDSAVGIVVPDLASRAGDVRRVFLDIFAPDWRISGVPAGLPLNVSFGRPLSDVSVVHTALLLLRLIDTHVPFRDFSLLLRSPWLKGAAAEYSPRGRLEVELRNRLRQQFALRDAQPLCQKYAPRFATTLAVLIESAIPAGRRSIRQWAEQFSAQLLAAGWPGDTAIDSETWQALRKWNELLADFVGSTQVQQDEIDRDTALTWLMKLARECTFQPEGVADGVQIMGVLEAAGLEFDHLWICGMARELWPPAARPSAFVPLDLQRRLLMPDSTAACTLEYAERVLQRLFGSARFVTVSWPLQQDGEPLRVSPLPEKLLQAALAEAPSAVDWPLWNELAIAQGRVEILEHDPPPVLMADQVTRGGASVLNLQAVSPLNAFIEKRLGAALMELSRLGIDARERGNLIHNVLEKFYGEFPNRTLAAGLSVEQRRAWLAAALARALDELPGLADLFMQTLARFEMAILLPRLESFIEMDLQRPDFQVLACEAKHQVRIASLQLTIKLDRLDEIADGRKLVIDYKTGEIDRQVWNPAKPRDLQLPLYVSTVVPEASAVAFAQISARSIGYDGVGAADTGISGLRTPGARSRTEVKFQYPQSEEMILSWDDLRTAWQTVLHGLAEQFVAGDFRLDPRNPESARGQFAVLSRIYDVGLGMYEDEA